MLWITLDTTRVDHLGSYGATDVATPNLDRLAAEGTRFERAYATVPLTTPSHASMFTGLYPPRHGVHTNGDAILADHHTTLAELLRDHHGYATAATRDQAPAIAAAPDDPDVLLLHANITAKMGDMPAAT